MISISPFGTLGLLASLLVAILYQGNHDRKYMPGSIVLIWRYILRMQALLECYIDMKSSQLGSLNHLFCRKVLFSTDPDCQFPDVSQAMMQT